MADMDDYNQQIIAEFRANGGKVGGRFEGLPMVLVTHTGAKSGVRRTTPLVCSRDGDTVVIIASMGGAPNNPAWYHNMVANPGVTVEVGSDTYEATVVVTEGDERQRLFDAQAAIMPFFNDYAASTSRVIPVLKLVRN
ncbi:MAG: Deazaflavin-dependent nitroreductase [Actinomycetota bacterium]|jgi:deazaflavin-dependent oxidoreductase (nitroreductase family)